MNRQTFEQASVRRHKRRLATLFLFLCAALPLPAKDNKQQTSAAVKVVAHMTFDNKLPADMLIQQVNGKPYLFAQLANAQGVVVVDISKPHKLKIVSSLSCQDGNGGSQLSVDGNAAVLTTIAGDVNTQPSGKGDLALWDIADPGNPRLVQRFSGVLRVLRDASNYTYILNQDGLWVVYDKQNSPATDDNKWLEATYAGG